MKSLRILALAAVVCIASSAAHAQQQQVLLAADFAQAAVTTEPTDRVVVGKVTFVSNRRALTVVDVGGGAKALRFRFGKGGWLRASFAATTLQPGHTLSLQTQLQFPDGAPDKGGALRAGLYALATPDTLEGVAADQGFMFVTNPGSATGEPDTTVVRDNAHAATSGKWPGIFGGGDGTTRAEGKGPLLNLGRDVAKLDVTTQLTADKKPSWRTSLVLSTTAAPVTYAASFGTSKDFPAPAFNTAGLSLGTGDTLLLRGFVVTLITPPASSKK